RLAKKCDHVTIIIVTRLRCKKLQINARNDGSHFVNRLEHMVAHFLLHFGQPFSKVQAPLGTTLPTFAPNLLQLSAMVNSQHFQQGFRLNDVLGFLALTDIPALGDNEFMKREAMGIWYADVNTAAMEH